MKCATMSFNSLPAKYRPGQPTKYIRLCSGSTFVRQRTHYSMAKRKVIPTRGCRLVVESLRFSIGVAITPGIKYIDWLIARNLYGASVGVKSEGRGSDESSFR